MLYTIGGSFHLLLCDQCFSSHVAPSAPCTPSSSLHHRRPGGLATNAEKRFVEPSQGVWKCSRTARRDFCSGWSRTRQLPKLSSLMPSPPLARGKQSSGRCTTPTCAVSEFMSFQPICRCHPFHMPANPPPPARAFSPPLPPCTVSIQKCERVRLFFNLRNRTFDAP